MFIKEYLFKTCISFFFLLVFFVSAQITFSQATGKGNTLTSYQKLAREIFKELIEINTTSAKGSTPAAEAMATRLRMAGFPDKDIHLSGTHQAACKTRIALRLHRGES